jgi:hypothetical protein
MSDFSEAVPKERKAKILEDQSRRLRGQKSLSGRASEKREHLSGD